MYEKPVFFDETISEELPIGRALIAGDKFTSQNAIALRETQKLLPEFQNLLYNSEFTILDGGDRALPQQWQFAPKELLREVRIPSADFSANADNALHFQRRQIDDNAAVYQNIYYHLYDDTSFEITVELGNTTNDIQIVEVKLHADYLPEDSDTISCKFVIPPNAPLRQYILRDTLEIKDDSPWDRYIRFEVVLLNENSGADILLDNVSVEYREGIYQESQCYSPHLVQAFGNGQIIARKELANPNETVQVYAGTNVNWWEDTELGVGRIIDSPQIFEEETWYRIQWVEDSFVNIEDKNPITRPLLDSTKRYTIYHHYTLF